MRLSMWKIRCVLCPLPSALPLPSHQAQTTPQNLPVPHRVRSGFCALLRPFCYFYSCASPWAVFSHAGCLFCNCFLTNTCVFSGAAVILSWQVLFQTQLSRCPWPGQLRLPKRWGPHVKNRVLPAAWPAWSEPRARYRRAQRARGWGTRVPDLSKILAPAIPKHTYVGWEIREILLVILLSLEKVKESAFCFFFFFAHGKIMPASLEIRCLKVEDFC